MNYIRRALSDTFSGQAKALIVLILGGVLSLLFLYFTESASVALEEIPYVSGAIFGAFGALFLLFLWNLACSPYRIERDAHLNTKRLLPNTQSLSEFISSREFFTLKEVACIKSGQPISHGELSGPASGYLYDLKKMVMSGELAPSKVPDPFLRTDIQFLKKNPGRDAFLFASDDTKQKLEDVEVSKVDLIRLGIISELHSRQ